MESAIPRHLPKGKGKEKRTQSTDPTQSKLPNSLRQKVLDGLKKEYVKMGSSEQEAQQKAISEEKSISQEYRSVVLYLTAATNHLKKLRIRSAGIQNGPAPKRRKTAPPSEQRPKEGTAWSLCPSDGVFPLDELLSGATQPVPEPGKPAKQPPTRRRSSKDGLDQNHCDQQQLLNPVSLSEIALPNSTLKAAGTVYKSSGPDSEYYFTFSGETKMRQLSSLQNVTFLDSDPEESCDQSHVLSSEQQQQADIEAGRINVTGTFDLFQDKKTKKVKVKPFRKQTAEPKANKAKASAVVSSSKNNFSVIQKRKCDDFTIDVFYDLLESAYTMAEGELVENGYPRPSEQERVAKINWKESSPIVTPVGSKAMRHTCCRCRKPFLIYENGRYQDVEECIYHYGRLRKHRDVVLGTVSEYSCCRSDQESQGCQVAKMHVIDAEKNPLQEGYVQTTASNKRGATPDRQVYALDCEMCYTTAGLELTRVTVVNMECESVYESLVVPPHPITDYNTRFSGLGPGDFHGVATTLADVQARILGMVSRDTLLVGHSLESDLRTLKIIHSKVVDTAIVFPHRMGPPYKRALKTLMAEHLNKIIQESADGGHDSAEDARSCMELMLMKAKSDFLKKFRTGM